MEFLMGEPNKPPTLGAVMRGIRARNDWTLKEMSAKSGIPVSTLSKVEHDRLTLSYEKLQQLRRRLNIRMARSEERRGGKACDSKCRSRGAPYHDKKNKADK